MSLDFSKVPGLESAEIKEVKLEQSGPVTIPDPFDLKRAKQHFTVYDDKLAQMQKQADKAKITDEQSAAHATEMMAQANSLKKEIEKRRKHIVDDAYSFYKAVLGFSKPYEAALDKIVRTIKDKYGQWSYQVEMERRKAEKKAQEAAAKKQKEMDQAAKKAGIDPVAMPTPVLPKKQEPTRTDTGTASTKMVWDFEVMDFSQLPDKYKLVDEKAIRAAIRAGIREIPGVKIEEKPQVSVRSR